MQGTRPTITIGKTKTAGCGLTVAFHTTDDPGTCELIMRDPGQRVTYWALSQHELKQMICAAQAVLDQMRANS